MIATDLATVGRCDAVLRLGDGVLGLHAAGLDRVAFSDGELGIDRAPGPALLASVTVSMSSVSVSDHASPADRTDFTFLPR